jgi:lipopolysaccharide transport system ATP-binding protein
MSSEITIRVENLSKCYQIYEKPQDRLKQSIYPRLQRLIGVEPENYYQEFWALQDIAFEVSKGQTLGILGRNGSGKSTLLQILCGTLNPTSGSIQVKGKVAALLELGSGFNPEFTGRENVWMNASLLGLTNKQIEQRLDDIFAFADIGDFVDQPVKIYSSGMVLRLAFAVIAHVDADILVIDEALAVGDVFFVQKCMRFIKDFAARNTLLFVSHDTQSVLSLCNSAIVLDSGKQVFTGQPKAAVQYYSKMQYAGFQKIDLFPDQDLPKNSQDAFNGSGEEFDDTSNFIQKNDFSFVQQDSRMELVTKHDLLGRLEHVSTTLNSGFGDGKATIVEVGFVDENGSPITNVTSYSLVHLKVKVRAKNVIISPIIGFSLVNRHGLAIIADNTFLSSMEKLPLQFNPGDEFQGCFTFQLPSLPGGDYALNVAVASGTQINHKQHHYIYEAVCFKSSPSFTVFGECNPPMIRCSIMPITQSNPNVVH